LFNPDKDVVDVYRQDSTGRFGAPIRHGRTALPTSPLLPELHVPLDNVFR